MRKRKWQLAALVLSAALLLSGCGEYLRSLASRYSFYEMTPYSQMEYSRPDMAQLEQLLDDCCQAAEEGTDIDRVMECIYAYYEAYDWFYTSYFLADIRYCGDLTDIYWEEEYNFCLENTAAVDAGLEELYRALAASPLRQALEGENYFGAGFFDAYEGESLWDETFLALMEQEAQLESEYYALAEEALESEYYSEEYFTRHGSRMAELFVDIIGLRQQIAAYAGFDSYPEFAYEMYHYRDYTPAQAEAYLQVAGQELSGLYRQTNTSALWELSDGYCSEQDTFQYVRQATAQMGGVVEEAFSQLEQAGLYDIAYGENKYDSSFEVYLWSYYAPFVFMNPYLDQTDKLTFAHEFGHFANDYVCWGSGAGTDVAEVHSQAMEYLSLCYTEGAEDLEAYKLADSLCVYVEQAAYALFEHQVYGLTGEALTVENVQALYERIGIEFGLDSWDGWDSRDYVAITHLYTEPMYMVSYVVSNDLAMQIYQQEKASAGAGLTTYERCLESQDTYLLDFAENYGLESPFADGRLGAVKATFEKELAPYL